MGSGVEIGLDASELLARVGEVKRRGADLSPTMAIVAEQLVAAVSDEFESAGRGRWPELAESTLRGRRGSEAQILQDTGRFAASVRGDSSADFAEAATDVAYAVYHVSDEPREVIPLRNPFDVDPAVIDSAVEIILRALAGERTALA